MIELGEQPEPTAEEPQLHPGGADSLADEEKYGQFMDRPTPPDLPPEANPAVDETPEGVTEPDDKKQEPNGEEDQEADTERSPSAGQEDEAGNPEEPA